MVESDSLNKVQAINRNYDFAKESLILGNFENFLRKILKL